MLIQQILVSFLQTILSKICDDCIRHYPFRINSCEIKSIIIMIEITMKVIN